MRKRFTSLRGLKNCIPILFMMMGIQLFAQISVKGTVTSKNNEPIPGVNVLVEGSSSGTTTDFDGNYTLEVSGEETVLNFTYVGFIPQSITVGNQRTIDVVLEEKLESLEQIVVIGYGSRRKSDLTGSVTSVAAEDITAYPAVDVAQTLQGRAAGVSVQSINGGEPGATQRIRIRGATSLNSPSDAIFVVDGFIGAALPPPEDIESIQILKDASSTAIYGARGANGVVIVTTKRGKKGQMRVDFNTSYSTQQTTNRLDVLEADQFIEYIGIIGRDLENTGINTDWQNEIYRTGEISNYQLAIAGGGEKVKYYVSGTYFDQAGIIINSDLTRFSFNTNVDIDVSDNLKVGMSSFGRRTNIDGVRTQESSGGAPNAGVVSSAYRFGTNIGIRNDDGTFTTNNIGTDLNNAVAIATGIIDERENDLYQLNTYAEFNLFKGLKFKSTLGFNTRNDRRGRYFPSTLFAGNVPDIEDPDTGEVMETLDGQARVNHVRSTRILSENYINYKNDLSFAELEVTTGYSYQKTKRETFEIRARGFVSDIFSYRNIDSAQNFDQEQASNLTETELASFFGRVNFDILEKYLFTFAGRYDGSSTFAVNNKWGFFPSGAFAWNMGRESFLADSGVISNWKWRASFGLTGNFPTTAYRSLRSVDIEPQIINGERELTLTPGNLGNPNLKWETTTQYNFGLDLGFFNGRINITADYYQMNTEDLLYTRQLDPIRGFPNAFQLLNFGEIENKGYELELSTKNLVGAFTWSTDFNISKNENKVISLPENNEEIMSGPNSFFNGPTQILREGQPVGAFFGYIYDGVYQLEDQLAGLPTLDTRDVNNVPVPLVGGEKFRDVAGPDGTGPDGILDGNDRQIIGDPNPDFIMGLNNTFTYKGLDLNIFFNAAIGGDMYNLTFAELGGLNGNANTLVEFYENSWRPDNTNTDVPIISNERNIRSSSRWIYDGSYVRLKNVTLGYSFDKKLLESLKMTKLRLYISGQNLMTFTNYPGVDPEVSFNTDNSTDRNRNIGLDYGSYPNVRNITMGINVSF